MILVTLSDKERNLFAMYCEAQAESENGMAEQIGQLPGHEPMTKRMKAKAAAYAIVANELGRDSETVTL